MKNDEIKIKEDERGEKKFFFFLCMCVYIYVYKEGKEVKWVEERVSLAVRI